MKILFIVLLIIGFQNCYSQNTDSKINERLDSITLDQKKVNETQKKEIEELEETLKSYKIKESLFANQLAILTAIFSAIVAISILVMGWLVPKIFDSENKAKIKLLDAECKSIRDEIKTSRKDTQTVALLSTYRNSRNMFITCLGGQKSKFSPFIWALRAASDTINYKQDNLEIEEIVPFLNSAKSLLSELDKYPEKLKEFIDEVNELLQKINVGAGIKFKQLIPVIKEIKDEANHICWKKKDEVERIKTV